MSWHEPELRLPRVKRFMSVAIFPGRRGGAQRLAITIGRPWADELGLDKGDKILFLFGRLADRGMARIEPSPNEDPRGRVLRPNGGHNRPGYSLRLELSASCCKATGPHRSERSKHVAVVEGGLVFTLPWWAQEAEEEGA